MSLLNDRSYLIVGLGNPGAAYEETRHNIGFRIVKEFARRKSFVFRHDSQMSGDIAQGRVAGIKVILLLPMTYMNSSGQAVRRCVDYFKVGLEQSMAICDDIALPLGTLRVRNGGSSGGHNGLRSIEEHLGTQEYPRLRVGIGDRLHGDLPSYVLGRFQSQEQSELLNVVEDALKTLDLWIGEGLTRAIRFANTSKKLKEGETNV